MSFAARGAAARRFTAGTSLAAPRRASLVDDGIHPTRPAAAAGLSGHRRSPHDVLLPTNAYQADALGEGGCPASDRRGVHGPGGCGSRWWSHWSRWSSWWRSAPGGSPGPWPRRRALARASASTPSTPASSRSSRVETRGRIHDVRVVDPPRRPARRRRGPTGSASATRPTEPPVDLTQTAQPDDGREGRADLDRTGAGRRDDPRRGGGAGAAGEGRDHQRPRSSHSTSVRRWSTSTTAPRRHLPSPWPSRGRRRCRRRWPPAPPRRASGSSTCRPTSEPRHGRGRSRGRRVRGALLGRRVLIRRRERPALPGST